jgi:hypothetical protein
MSIELLAQRLEARIQQVCQPQARYRVLWVIGSPRSGKTSLCRFVCRHRGWKYVDFTLEPGFLDCLLGKEETYRPEDFLGFLHLLCDNTVEEVIVLDEVEPLLGLWTWEQRESFFKQVGYATRLKTGVVIVTRLSTTQELIKLVPGGDHLFEIPQGVEP